MATETPQRDQNTCNMQTEHGEHTHGPTCGHESRPHQDHTDYQHDGHWHAQHGSHWDEHKS